MTDRLQMGCRSVKQTLQMAHKRLWLGTLSLVFTVHAAQLIPCRLYLYRRENKGETNETRSYTRNWKTTTATDRHGAILRGPNIAVFFVLVVGGRFSD